MAGEQWPQRSRSMRVVEREKDSQPSNTSRARERPLPASQAGSPSYSPLGYLQQRGSSGGESGTAADAGYVSYERDSYQNSFHKIPTLPTVRSLYQTQIQLIIPA
ncbi:hypothetical protein AZE42_05623 [Rhizopogon vesiculosus]|uniref:Uncharacterized protein n=1 Tax=Rhizopogon vesiculosus TaxID=180088 RepID=A0A1J8R7W3_9AGAM|nr:hypothetical protein AZE42_05623 [Rhizopogon vesiculosus]